MKKKLIDLFKGFVGSLEYSFSRFSMPKDELIVLCMHSTPRDRIVKFEETLDFLLKHFKPLAPKDLPDYFSGRLQDGPYILFTFDDGLKNNLHVAKLFEGKGLRAFFFLVPNFVKTKHQQEYYRKNIRVDIDPTFDKLEEDFTAMNEDDVRRLLSAEHRIGSHTMSHLLQSGWSQTDIIREVTESQYELSKLFKDPVESFCSPVNTFFSVDGFTKREIAKSYKYHFTTFPGSNARLKDAQLIFRRNIEVNWPLSKIKFALGQWDLFRWSDQIQDYRNR